MQPKTPRVYKGQVIFLSKQRNMLKSSHPYCIRNSRPTSGVPNLWTAHIWHCSLHLSVQNCGYPPLVMMHMAGWNPMRRKHSRHFIKLCQMLESASYLCDFHVNFFSFSPEDVHFEKKVKTRLSHALSALPINSNLGKTRETDRLNSLETFLFPFHLVVQPTLDWWQLAALRSNFRKPQTVFCPLRKRALPVSCSQHVGGGSCVGLVQKSTKKKTKPVPIEFYFCVFFGRAGSVISSPHRGHPDFRLQNTSSRRSPCVCLHSVQRNIRANQRGKDPLSSLPLIYRAWTLREADLSFHLNDYAVRWWGLLHNNIASHSKSTRGPQRTEKKKKTYNPRVSRK